MPNRLREMRERTGLTQEELAAQVGVSRQTIISLEKGKYNPSISLAYSLAKVFSMSIEDLFLLDERKVEDE
ncbi:MAG: helix-turn-helix transcriptional regulator [Syntrophomonadaceae bacterium]|jgi:putative transcriptional regulator